MTMRLLLTTLLAATLATVSLAEEFCCRGSKGKEDPCNPTKWNCWPMKRVARYGTCGRRGDTDCLYDVPDSNKDNCCFTQAGCYGLENTCYGISEVPDDEAELYCTEDGPFFLPGGVPASGFRGTVCGGDGFGGLDPHFQVRSCLLCRWESIANLSDANDIIAHADMEWDLV